MATKQTFIQIVDKKTGRIEEVVSSRTLEALDIEKKIALTKGKELYVVTHILEPVIKIEMKQKKIVEAVSYIEPDSSLNVQIDVENREEEIIAEEKPIKKTRKSTKKTDESANDTPVEESKKNNSRKKKATSNQD